MMSVIIPVATCLVGLAVGAAGSYVACRVTVKVATNKLAVERVLLGCLIGACKTILSDAFQKKVERKYIELANAEIEKLNK